jgi:maleylpyruvate isomerase
VRTALHYKGLTFEYVPVHLVKREQFAEGYARLNPMEQVPTLELDDGRRLTQSLAIIEYLDETHPTPPLLPRDPYLRARARQLAEVVNSGIQPLQNTSVMQKIKQDGGDDRAWNQHWIDKGLRALDATAADCAGTFLVGDSVSIADVCLVPQLYNARRFDVPISALLMRIEEACLALPAFQAAHADRQPDTQK